MIQLSDHFTYKKLLSFCFPTIIMMVFTSIYGVVDGLFVSNYVGKTPFAAINLIMPFIMVLGGFGFMIGTGGSALVAKTLGENKKEQANRYFTMLIAFTVLLGILISVFGFLFLPYVADLLGADAAMKEHCITYGRIMMVFNTAYMLQNVFQSFLITAEKPKLGLFVILASGISNMVLDAFFIAVLDMGVAGAALATGIGECIGGILPLIYFLIRKDSRIAFSNWHWDFKALWKACSNGASELMTSISGSLVAMLYNAQLLRYAGENGIAAYGVLMYVQFIFIAVFIGYSIGTAPIISYHYGAENFNELKNMLNKSVRLTGFGGIAMMALGFMLAGSIAQIFVGYDKELCDITVTAFHIYSFHFILAGINIFSSSFFTALNNGGISAAISFLRSCVFQLLSILILPLYFGIEGIWWAVSVAEVFACLISCAFLYYKRCDYHYF